MKQLLLICAACTTMSVSAQTVVLPSGQVITLPPPSFPVSAPPGEVEKMRASFKVKAADGVSHTEKSPEKVKIFFDRYKQAAGYLAATEARKTKPAATMGAQKVPEVHRDLTGLKLSFRPVPFQRATLVAATPSGTNVNGNWTGVERFFTIPGVGTATLTEYDLAASGGRVSMLKEAVNGSVNGGPAVSRVIMNDVGDSIEEVTWMNGNVYSILVFGPNVVASANGMKTKAVKNVTGLTLAQELR